MLLACGGEESTGPPPPPRPETPRATSISITPANVSLVALGDTVRLAAEVRDQNGREMAGATVAWASDSPAVATVNASGLVMAAGNGSTAVTATSGPATGTASVTVMQRANSVAVSPAADTLVRSDTLRLTAEATDANGHPVAGTEFSWTSSDTMVAAVDTSGLVTAVSAGEAQVTATAAGITGRAQLTVVAPAPTTVAITPDTVALTALEQTAQLAAEVRDQAGRVMEGVAVSWSSADTTVAAVDSAGLVTAAGAGVTTITATAGEASGAALVSVMQSAGSVVVVPPADTVAPGDTLRLVAAAFDANGHMVGGAAFAWSSDDVSVATVNAAGLVTGVAEGTATIAATAGSARGTSEITVVNPDRAALAAFYEATDGPNWHNSENWLTDAPLGEWFGVTTNREGRLTRLDLALNELTGPIPPGLGNLASLTRLDLGTNDLTGPIPTGLGNLASLTELYLGGNELTGPIPPELGNLASLRWLSLGLNDLTGPIPPELGELSHLEQLQLSRNSLTGEIPAELGNLASLRGLRLSANDLVGSIPPQLGNLASLESLSLKETGLWGPIPSSFLRLGRLQALSIEFTGLCVPGTSFFAAWLQGLQLHDAEASQWCNAADVTALRSLYEATGGSGWTESRGWLSDHVPEEWHGVTADSLGNATELDLHGNSLAGRLPATLGDLTRMTVLRIGDNEISGRLPTRLAGLPLVEFEYAETELCVPVEEAFQAWLNTIPAHAGTGVECAPLSDRDILDVLYDVTGGPSWTNNDNWLTDAPLGERFGVLIDGEGRVVNLQLTGNNLTGPIPPELGNLASLRWLDLRFNDLTGPIPAELGNLTNLGALWLETNDLTGPIPAELGNLTSLELLWLGANDLTGPIPAELGNLTNLGALWLEANDLTGPIPAELGNLASLGTLWLEANDLTGPIPPELGSLSVLGELLLGNNDLSGSVPPELAALTSLRALILSNNEALDGPLPDGLTALGLLETLLAGGTGLCAPMDPTVLAWLGGIRKRRITMCAEAEPAAAYLTQAVQSLEFPVPLVAGAKALLRVFPTAARTTSAGIPPVRARFYIDDREAHVANVPGTSGPIPTEVSEGNLSNSANVEVPGSVVRPGLEMVIEVDPEGTLDPGLGVAGRIPETGRLAVDVEVMPTLELTMIPFLWSPRPDSLVLDLVEAMADDPDGHELLRMTRELLPIGELAVTAHEPVITSHNSSRALIFETEAIRVLEGERGHYVGTMTGEFRGVDGLALGIGSRTSFAKIDKGERSEFVIAHELGHNMSLQHPEGCRAGNPDYAYPHANGRIGAWGYDFEAERLVPPNVRDLMSYCTFEYEWISDYHFSNALRYRLEDEVETDASVVAAPQKSLLLWGGVAADSVPFLEPAFVVEAPPALPRTDGPYRLSGRARDGSELFSLSAGMSEAIDGNGSSSFAFVLPVGPDWEDNLVSITLLGPRRSVTLDADSDLPAVILRDPLSGRVRGILRDLGGSASTLVDTVAARSPEPGLEVLFSSGIPDAEAWNREERE